MVVDAMLEGRERGFDFAGYMHKPATPMMSHARPFAPHGRLVRMVCTRKARIIESNNFAIIWE